MKHLTLLSAFIFIVTMTTSGYAASPHGGNMHDKGGMPEFTQEYVNAMNNMHDPMMKGAMDSDPDAAFVRGMLWHHRGAVDMAKIQLKYGKDSEMRKMAQAIIDAQASEIKQMEDWLKKRNLPQ